MLWNTRAAIQRDNRHAVRAPGVRLLRLPAHRTLPLRSEEGGEHLIYCSGQGCSGHVVADNGSLLQRVAGSGRTISANTLMHSNGRGTPKISNYCYLGADPNAMRLKPDATQ